MPKISKIFNPNSTRFILFNSVGDEKVIERTEKILRGITKIVSLFPRGEIKN